MLLYANSPSPLTLLTLTAPRALAFVKYKFDVPSLKSSVEAAAILASALVSVKYKLLEPSLKSSVSAAAIQLQIQMI